MTKPPVSDIQMLKINNHLTGILLSLGESSTEHPRRETTPEIGEGNILAVLLRYYRYSYSSQHV
jgi:hypothetical protein